MKKLSFLKKGNLLYVKMRNNLINKKFLWIMNYEFNSQYLALAMCIQRSILFYSCETIFLLLVIITILNLILGKGLHALLFIFYLKLNFQKYTKIVIINDIFDYYAITLFSC